MTPRTWPKQFRAAASTFDWPALAQLAAEYATHLYAVPALPDSVGQVLLVLRQSRRYEELKLVADAALAHGPDAPAVRRHYAQALVDRGNPAVALRLYTGLAADETAPRSERIEARGGIGRCYKEMFLACTEPDRGRRLLSRSLEVYLAAYLEDTDVYTWHGINAVALLARAARDGIPLPSGSPTAAALAGDILRTVVIQHHDRLRIAQVRENEPLQRGQRRLPVPGMLGQQRLHPPRRDMPGHLRQLPARLAVTALGQQRADIRERRQTRSGLGEHRREQTTQLTVKFSPARRHLL